MLLLPHHFHPVFSLSICSSCFYTVSILFLLYSIIYMQLFPSFPYRFIIHNALFPSFTSCLHHLHALFPSCFHSIPSFICSVSIVSILFLLFSIISMLCFHRFHPVSTLFHHLHALFPSGVYPPSEHEAILPPSFSSRLTCHNLPSLTSGIMVYPCSASPLQGFSLSHLTWSSIFITSRPLP